MIKVTNRIKGIIERDRKVFLTTTRGSIPFVASSGDGDFAYDIEGNRLIDFSSFISVYNLGVNSTDDARRAIKSQVDRLMHAAFTDYYSELPVSFGEDLLRMFPKGFGRIFLSNSGTEANEAAIKFSRIFTKRPYIISFYNAFHGRTMGSLGLTAAKSVHREHFGPFSGVIHAPYPYPYRCPFSHDHAECGMDYIEYLKDYVLSKEVSPEEVAAIFLEPVQGEGGYIVPPQNFVRELRKLATEHGILLVSDEVQAGYMRAGKFLALDNFGVAADIYTMAKSLGAGLPFGATVTRSSLGDIPAGAHANTFGGNLAAVAGAHAQLKYLEKNRQQLERQVSDKGRAILRRLMKMKDDYDIVGDVRGLGMMIGVELVKSKRGKEPAAKEQEQVIMDSFMNGLLLLPAGQSTIRIIPPITVSRENLEKGLDIFEKAVAKADKSLRHK
ncbi:MAG: aminotransferase class III-fold pyridoxal phosphate-dependent enzyme [Candidatus Micrarchaeota archaeon]|nr:aminotransferase class III-fold pyridoxal phosphate-dependent enzyme [Candidatus Micrarchaeota archaeon]